MSPCRPDHFGPSVWLTAIALLTAFTPIVARADAAGAGIWTLTLVHLAPRSSSGELTLSEVGGQPVNQPQPGTAVRVLPADTLLVAYEHYFTDHIAYQVVVGWPPTHKLKGAGTLDAVDVIGDGQQYSPAVILKYHFLDPANDLRPYAGVGLNYTWFRRNRITNDAFRQATYGPNSTTQVSASPSWNLVYNLGADYRLNERWSLGLSLAYAPLKTRITVAADNTAIGVPFKVITDVKNRTVATGVNVGYRF